MRVKFIGADSMGVRSLATFVETKDVKLFIDPGVALAPYRYGYGPHPIEIERMNDVWDKIVKHVEKADIVITSHYHYDHYNPDEPEIFEDKELYLKDPKHNINRSQKGRSKLFIEELEKVKGVKWHVAEKQEIEIGETRIELSEAVPHGPSTRLGYVVETFIKERRGKKSKGSKDVRRFLHTSDVEGPCLDVQIAFIEKHLPELLLVDGPLSYIMQRYGHKNLEIALSNLKKLADKVEWLVYEHHFLRDLHYKEKIAPVEAEAKKKKHNALTAAEFMGRKTEVLENIRKKLYEEYPV